jgi:hypothetical protein
VIFFALDPYGGFFMSVTIAFLNRSMLVTGGQLIPYSDLSSATIAGNQMYIYSIHSVTGLDYETMQRLPVNHVVIAVMLLCLMRVVFKHRFLTSRLAIPVVVSAIFLLNMKFDFGDASFFVKGSGAALFVLFVSLVVRFLNTRSTSIMVSLIVIYCSCTLFDYTSQAWMIMALIPLAFVRSRLDQRTAPRFYIMLVLGVVLFLGFRWIVYNGYLPWMNQFLVGSSIKNFLFTLPYNGHALYYPYAGRQEVVLSVFFANALAFGMGFLVAVCFSISSIRKSRLQNWNKDSVLMWCLLLPFPITLLMYLPIGLLALAYPILMLPCISVLCLALLLNKRAPLHLNSGRIAMKKLTPVALFASALLVLSFVSYSGAILSGTILTTSDSDMNDGARWLLAHHQDRTYVLSDLDSLGKFLVVWSSSSLSSYDNLTLVYYDVDYYSRVVEPSPPLNGVGNSTSSLPLYVVVDVKSSTPVSSLNWSSFQPLAWHLPEIESNGVMSQVYDDGTCLTLIIPSGGY